MSNVMEDKSLAFAVRIVNLCRLLNDRYAETIISRQLLRSGTAIGASIHESEFAQSKPDFITKLSISLKEANETKFWLMLLHKTSYIDDKGYESMARDCKELIAMLVASLKTAKKQEEDWASRHY